MFTSGTPRMPHIQYILKGVWWAYPAEMLLVMWTSCNLYEPGRDRWCILVSHARKVLSGASSGLLIKWTLTNSMETLPHHKLCIMVRQCRTDHIRYIGLQQHAWTARAMLKPRSPQPVWPTRACTSNCCNGLYVAVLKCSCMLCWTWGHWH